MVLIQFIINYLEHYYIDFAFDEPSGMHKNGILCRSKDLPQEKKLPLRTPDGINYVPSSDARILNDYHCTVLSLRVQCSIL